MKPLRVAVLVNLPRDKASGGHVKYWERMAQAAVQSGADVDLTVYFSGDGADEILSPQVRFRYMPIAFSTAKLKFIPYVPSHTDLAPFHARLAQELDSYDVIHTTDGYFAFARTAEYIARWNDIPLVSSFHTATPAYAELFARKTIENLFGTRWGDFLSHTSKIPARARRTKERRLKKHLRQCSAILAMRPEDIHFAEHAAGRAQIMPMRQGVDKDLFSPDKKDRPRMLREYGIPQDRCVILFVGRVDAGKNVPLLVDAVAEALQRGAPLHLIAAGLGPMSGEVKNRLGQHATLAGQIPSEDLARLYASVDCLTIASDIEIGGMIALEAMAACCPVLVSRQSGIAQLCGDTPAMRQIDSDTAAWAKEFAAITRDPARLAQMRQDAMIFRRDHLAGWDDVLLQDFMPVWRRAANKETGKEHSHDLRQTHSDFNPAP